MLSIQDVAKMTGLTSRALRLYEEVGILAADERGAAGVRRYSAASVDKLRRIVAMKATGVTLRELSGLLEGTEASVDGVFERRIAKIDAQQAELAEKRAALASFLATNAGISGADVGERLALSHRERLELFAFEHLERSGAGDAHASYLATELACFKARPDAYPLILAVKRVVDFARAQNIPIGPGRGSAPSSLLFHLIGLSQRDPVSYGLKPARIFGASQAIWFDTSFGRGKPLVDLCDELSASLKPWKIEAFRLPLLDIFERVHDRLGGAPDYAAISDDAPEVLGPIQRGDVEKILWLDEPQDTLVSKIYPEQIDGWAGHEKVNAWLREQHIETFSDVLRIIAMRRPTSAAMIARMEEFTENGAGMRIFHEDFIELLEQHTDWDPLRINDVRFRAMKRRLTDADRKDLARDAGDEVLRILETEAPFGFCRAHVVGSADLVKRCAVLKSRHKAVYFDEIARWEDENGLSWSEFGIHNEQVCVLK